VPDSCRHNQPRAIASASPAPYSAGLPPSVNRNGPLIFSMWMRPNGLDRERDLEQFSRHGLGVGERPVGHVSHRRRIPSVACAEGDMRHMNQVLFEAMTIEPLPAGTVHLAYFAHANRERRATPENRPRLAAAAVSARRASKASRASSNVAPMPLGVLRVRIPRRSRKSNAGDLRPAALFHCAQPGVRTRLPPLTSRRSADVATGIVKWFNPSKGYGFIQPDGGGKDVFVHISAVEKAGFTGLAEGAKVSYEIVSDRGKESAGNLRL
jgi:CspA family cold shock protein